MAGLRTGFGTLLHWLRTLRGHARFSVAMDRAQTRQALSGTRPDLDQLIETVRRDGVAALPGYWNAARCAQAVREMDRLISDNPGAVQVCSQGSDKRMYGVESGSALLMDFHADPLPRRFAELLGGREIYNFATLGARIEASPGNSGSGDGWHRDAAGFQFKAILYLTDTGPDNGPFQYMTASHTIWRAARDNMTADLADVTQTRYSDAAVARLAERGAQIPAFTARAGTLLLVNTAGIHRGMPLRAGARYALTNYYYLRAEIDEERIKKFSPLVPGTAERIRQDILSPVPSSRPTASTR